MLITLVALILNFQSAPLAATEPAATGRAALAAEHLYNGIHRPAIIDVVSPRSFGTVSLTLMDADGKVLAGPIEVHPGRVDLAEKLPQIWDLRRTAYLQILDLQQPVGSALVLQPMLSRLVPQTREEIHPTRGHKYSKVVDWIDENQPAPTPAASAPATTQPADANAKPEQLEPEPAAAVERLFTGLRMYPEHDVILHTTAGDIRLAMKPDEAPNTVWNFLELSRGGFYRDIEFHRVVPLTPTGQPFVIQAGDPTGTGDGGPGYWLPLENSGLEHEFGVISMARSDDPDSNGCQFFIALSREGTARLDGQYCAFGYAVGGAEAIKSIADTPIANLETGRPAAPPMIRDAELTPAPPRLVGRGRPDERVTVHGGHQQPQPSGRIPR